jgi:hypothetical protein
VSVEIHRGRAGEVESQPAGCPSYFAAWALSRTRDGKRVSMFFREQYDLRNVDLAEGQTIELSEDTPYRIELLIRRPRSGEDSSVKGTDCLATVRTDDVVTKNVREQFEIIDDPRPAVLEIGNRVCIRLNDYLRRALGLLRWRRGNTGHHNPIRFCRLLHWSDDGTTWKHVPGNLTLGIDFGIPRKQLGSDLLDSFMRLMKSGTSEPFAYELFHEAWNQRTDSPRSSLLTGITAAEIGVKSFISSMVPQAEWLAFHAPTPPLIQMLREYLPLLPARQLIGGRIFVPEELLKVLKKGITLRNQTAHAGDQIRPETLKEILIAVRDLLYLLDVYGGHTWAIELVSHETTERMRAGKSG